MNEIIDEIKIIKQEINDKDVQIAELNSKYTKICNYNEL